jgi:exosortase
MEFVKRKLKTAVALVRTYYLHIFAFALVLASIFVVYGNDFAILANEALQNEALSHILLLPFFVGFLFYLKKDVVKAALSLDKYGKRTSAKYVNEILGVVLCLVAFLVYWYGSQTFYPLEYHILSLPFFIAGVTLIFLNPRALIMLIFPILFLLFLVPIPATFLYTIGGGLANFNTQVSYVILKTVGLPITLSSSYGAPTILISSASGQPLNFAVDVACSGIYSLVAFAMFATFLAFLASTSIFKKLLLFILGFFVFAMLNILRIMAIVTVGYSFGEEAALLLHSFAGLLLIFIGMLLLLVFSDKVLKIRVMTKPQVQPPCPECERNTQPLMDFCQNCGRYIGKLHVHISKATFAKLLLLLLGCSIVVISIQAPTFVTTQDSFVLASNVSEQNATNIFPEISGYTLSFLYRDTAYEKIAHQDASLVYGYFPNNKSDSDLYADVGIANSISNLHSWEVCFVAIQTAQGQYPLVNVLDAREVQLLQNPPLIAQYFVFDSPDNYTQVTLYWFGKALFKTGLSVEAKYYRISLIILTRNSTVIPQLEQELLGTGKLIASALEPLKTQAILSLGIPTLQYLLIGSIVFLASTITGQYLAERRKTSRNLNLFGNFASQKEKIVLRTIQELAKTKKYIRTSDILESLNKQRGKAVNHKKVMDILRTLEEYGFIKRTVVSIGNTPSLVWRI